MLVQLLLVLKFIPWTSSQTVEKSGFIAGILQAKRNLVVLEMDTSKCFLDHMLIFLLCLCMLTVRD